MPIITHDDERFASEIYDHVFNRIKFYIYDYQGDETYTLDMPPDVYEHLKKLINEYQTALKATNND